MSADVSNVRWVVTVDRYMGILFVAVSATVRRALSIGHSVGIVASHCGVCWHRGFQF